MKMGFEENRWDPHYVRPDGRVSMAEIWAKEDAERKAAEQRMIDDARADAQAVWALADYLMPADAREFAERMGMAETLQEMWRNAFITGWRAALRRSST